MFKKSVALLSLTVVLSLALAGTASAYPLYTTKSPTMVTAQGKIFMFYRGADVSTDPNNIYWATFDGKSWSDMRKIPAAHGIIESPQNIAATVFNDRIIIAYQGVQKAHTIYWAELDLKTMKWKDHQVLIDTEKLGLFINGTPALATLGKLVYMTYQGGTPAYTIYAAVYDGSSWKNLHKVDATRSKNAFE